MEVNVYVQMVNMNPLNYLLMIKDVLILPVLMMELVLTVTTCV